MQIKNLKGGRPYNGDMPDVFAEEDHDPLNQMPWANKKRCRA